ncbi:MAG: hypothetical protein RIC85_05590 [Gammaproteobacteria bacterium]
MVASKEMKRTGVPMEKDISVNWLNEVDISNIGAEAAKGLKRGTNVVGGQDILLYKDIMAALYDKGKGNGRLEKTRDVFYNTGLAMYSIVFEAARQAVSLHGHPITAETYKAGLEAIEKFDANGRPDGADHRDGGGSRRRRPHAHRNVGRGHMGPANRLDRRLSGCRLEGC